MLSEHHALFGIGLGIGLFIGDMPLVPILLIICASILIDIDHILDYMIRFKSCNISNMNKYFRRKTCLNNNNIILPLFIFHNLEAIILLIILSFIFPIVSYITIGVFIHMTLDWMVMPTKRYPAVIKISLIWVLIENSRRKRGKHKW